MPGDARAGAGGDGSSAASVEPSEFREAMDTDDQLCSKQNEDFIAANRIKTLLLKMLFEERSLRLKEVGKLVSQNEVSRFFEFVQQDD